MACGIRLVIDTSFTGSNQGECADVEFYRNGEC
jgi:hypothetical protein